MASEKQQKIFKIKHKKHGYVVSNISKVVKFLPAKEDGSAPVGVKNYFEEKAAKDDIKMMTKGSFGHLQLKDFSVVGKEVTKSEVQPEFINPHHNTEDDE